MRGKSYLSIGSASPWGLPALSSIPTSSRSTWACGTKVESVDSPPHGGGNLRREEFARAMAWTKILYPQRRADLNRTDKVKSRAEKDADWEFVVKMTIIIRDLMTGNPKLEEMGLRRHRPQRHCRRLPGSTADRLQAERRLHRSTALLVVRLERYPRSLCAGYRKRCLQRYRYALWTPPHQ